jgi:D-xylose 1-dehydrogenase (NADP+, D-xylono-1,5-lactone-forming)
VRHRWGNNAKWALLVAFQDEQRFAMSPVRVGILSAADVANVFCAAVRTFPSAEVDVCAVASRSPEKAAMFAKANNIPRTCTYDELISDESIDAIYIPLPTGLATPFAVRVAAVGKHVLVDKPFDSVDGVASIVASCKQNNVAFLDGTHFVHSKRTADVLSAVARAGKVTHVSASFTHPVDISDLGAIRGDPSLEPAGALGDVGWYCFRAAVAMVGAEAAAVVDARCIAQFGPRGVVQSASGCVAMRGGAILSFDCGFEGPSRQRIEVVTSVGSIVVPEFVLPVGSSSPWDAVRPEGPEGLAEAGFVIETTCTNLDGKSQIVWPCSEHVEVHEGRHQAASMVAEFLKLIHVESDREKWAAETLATQSMLDCCLADALKKR